MSSSESSESLFSWLMREHGAEIAVHRFDTMRPIDLAILAVLIDPDAIANPDEAFRKAEAFANAISTYFLERRIELLSYKKSTMSAAQAYRDAQPLKELRAASPDITAPKSFPVNFDTALRHILRAKKTKAARKAVVERAWAARRRMVKQSHDPADQGVCSFLKGVQEAGRQINEYEFWMLGKLIRPYRDQRKLRARKKITRTA